MTQVIPAETTAMSEWLAPEGGWASDGNEDIAPAFPIISIVQPMTQIQGGIPGFFHHSDSGDQTGDFDGVLLVRRETRALFAKGDEKPVCRSDDGRNPVPHQRLWEMETVTLENGDRKAVPMLATQPNCANCPFAQWGGKYGDEPPPCSNSYIVIAARNGDPEDLVQVRIKGTSIKPFRQWVSRKLAPKRIPMFFFQVHLTTEEKTAPTRKWYQLVIESAPLNADDARVYSHIINAHRARIEQAVRESGGEVEEWAEPLEEMPFE